MRMRMTLGELRRILLVEFKRPDDNTVEFTMGDIMNCLIDSVHDVVNRQGSGDVYVPWRYAPKFQSPDLDALGKRYGFAPKDALALLKHDEVTEASEGQSLPVRLVISPEARTRTLSYFASNIASRYRGSNIDVIVPAASGSQMAFTLANLISAKLDGAPVVMKDALKKTRNEDLKVDERRWSAWVADRRAEGKSDAYIAKARKAAENYADALKRNHGVEPAEAKKGRRESRRFFLYQQPGDPVDLGDLRGKTVLVVDDNIDAGHTYENIDRILTAAGADMDNVYRVAAFDYSARPNKG